jgi:hypothetical protein
MVELDIFVYCSMWQRVTALKFHKVFTEELPKNANANPNYSIYGFHAIKMT